MTSTNDGKDVKSNQTSAQKGKSYYVNLYKSLDAKLNGEASFSERVTYLCSAWGHVHTLCVHSVPTTHPHLLSWIQRHTARTVLQSEWQSPSSKDEQTKLEEALDAFVQECNDAAASRGVLLAWESELQGRATWFKGLLADPWGHPVLKKAMLDSSETKPTTDEIVGWLKEERGVVFAARLRQLAVARCGDLALGLLTAVMERVREHRALVPDSVLMTDNHPDSPPSPPETSFESVLTMEAGFKDVWDLLTDMEFVLLHKHGKNNQLIDLAKVLPISSGYQIVERLLNRLQTEPREKKLWKNAKDVATLLIQVIITRCMVVPCCGRGVRRALYWSGRALARAVPEPRLPHALASLAAPAASARHLHTLAVAVRAHTHTHTHHVREHGQEHGQGQSSASSELKPYVVELYVRAITFGMNELEKLKLKPEYEKQEARATEQTLASWFLQLGQVVGASARMQCECDLTAFSVHPSPQMYQRIHVAPALPPLPAEPQQPSEEKVSVSEFGSWANDSRTQTNFVKTSEHLNIKQMQQANVLSTAVLTEGDALGLSSELCQDIAVLLAGPRHKTLSWDMDRSLLLENCRAYMERTGGGTRVITTELKYLNLDPSQYQHLPEEHDDEDDVYYGIEKGYEHLVELEPQPEEIWQDVDRTDTPQSSEGAGGSPRAASPATPASTASPASPAPPARRPSLYSSDSDDPLARHKQHKEEKKKERKKQKKKHKRKNSISDLIGVKVTKSESNVTDSDYDSQGKSSLYSEGVDEHIVDGQLSVDDLKSPKSSNLTISNAESRPAFKHTSLHVQTLSNKNVTTNINQNIERASPKVNNVMGHVIREEVKKSITKLIQFRRNKISEGSNSSASSNTSLGGSPTPQRPRTPASGPKVTNAHAKTLNSTSVTCPIQTCSRVQPYDAAQYRKTSRNIHLMDNTCSQSETHLNLSPRKPVIVNNSSTQLNESPEALLAHSMPDLNSPLQSQNCSRNTHLSSYQEFLQEWQKSANAGLFAVPESNKNSKKKKKQLKPISRVAPVVPNLNRTDRAVTPNVSNVKFDTKDTTTAPNLIHDARVNQTVHSMVKADTVISSICAKPVVQAKRAENAPNTFARLSYMHKNKNIDKKQLLDANLSLKTSIFEEIDRRIADLKCSKNKVIHNKHDYAASCFNDQTVSKQTANTKQPPKVEVQKIESPPRVSNTQHPLLTSILNNAGLTVKSSNDATITTNNNTQEDTKNKTSLLERDQQELLNLLSQQSLLNRSLTQSTLFSQMNRQNNPQHANVTNNSNVSSVLPQNKYYAEPGTSIQANRLNESKPVPVQAQMSTINNKINQNSQKPFEFPEISNSTIVKTTAMIRNKISVQKPHIEPKKRAPNQVTNEQKTVLEVNKAVSKKYVPKPPVSTPKYDDNVKEQNWTTVLDAIRAQRTPSRGPNALDMAFNKDSFQKVYERNQRINSSMQTNTFNSELKQALTTPPIDTTKQAVATPKPSVNNAQAYVQRKPVVKKTVEVPNKQHLDRNMTQQNPVMCYSKVTKQEQPHQREMIKEEEYKTLEELMDEELLQEIGELPSDDESCTPNVPTHKSMTHIIANKSHPVIQKVSGPLKESVRIPPKTINQPISNTATPAKQIKIISNEVVDYRNLTSKLIGAKVQGSTVTPSIPEEKIIVNVNNTFNINNITSTTPTTFVNETFPPMPVHNMVIVDPYKMCNQNYVTVNNNIPNVIYQQITPLMGSNLLIGNTFIPSVNTSVAPVRVVYNSPIMPTNIPTMHIPETLSAPPFSQTDNMSFSQQSTSVQQDNVSKSSSTINVSDVAANVIPDNKINTNQIKIGEGKVFSEVQDKLIKLNAESKSIENSELVNFKLNTETKSTEKVEPVKTNNLGLTIESKETMKQTTPVGINKKFEPTKIINPQTSVKRNKMFEIRNASALTNKQLNSAKIKHQGPTLQSNKNIETVNAKVKTQRSSAEAEAVSKPVIMKIQGQSTVSNKNLEPVTIIHKGALCKNKIEHLKIKTQETYDKMNIEPLNTQRTSGEKKIEPIKLKTLGLSDEIFIKRIKIKTQKARDGIKIESIIPKTQTEPEKSTKSEPVELDKMKEVKRLAQKKYTIINRNKSNYCKSPIPLTEIKEKQNVLAHNTELVGDKEVNHIPENHEVENTSKHTVQETKNYVSYDTVGNDKEKGSNYQSHRILLKSSNSLETEAITPVRNVDIEFAKKSQRELKQDLVVSQNLLKKTKEPISDTKSESNKLSNIESVCDSALNVGDEESDIADKTTLPVRVSKRILEKKFEQSKEKQRISKNTEKVDTQPNRIEKNKIITTSNSAKNLDIKAIQVNDNSVLKEKKDENVFDSEKEIVGAVKNKTSETLIAKSEGRNFRNEKVCQKEPLDDLNTIPSTNETSQKISSDVITVKPTKSTQSNEITTPEIITKENLSNNAIKNEAENTSDKTATQEQVNICKSAIPPVKVPLESTPIFDGDFVSKDLTAENENILTDKEITDKKSKGDKEVIISNDTPFPKEVVNKSIAKNSATKQSKTQMQSVEKQNDSKSRNDNDDPDQKNQSAESALQAAPDIIMKDNANHPRYSESGSVIKKAPALVIENQRANIIKVPQSTKPVKLNENLCLQNDNTHKSDMEVMGSEIITQNTKSDSAVLKSSKVVKKDYQINPPVVILPDEGPFLQSIIENKNTDVILSSDTDLDQKKTEGLSSNNPNDNDVTGKVKSFTDTIPESYKNKIKFEEIIEPGNNNPYLKFIRVILPDNRKFKATVRGKVNVNSLFEEPAVRNILLSCLGEKKRYTLNIQQVSTSDGKLVAMQNKEINVKQVNPATKLTAVETVDLISDDDDETELEIEHITTEFGSFKIRNNYDKDTFEKLKIKLLQKCSINLIRCDKLENNILSKVVPLEISDEVIEIDSSSEDETSQHTGIDVLKNLLLKELGVTDVQNDVLTTDTPQNVQPEHNSTNQRPSRTRKSKYHRERDSRPNSTEPKKCSAPKPKKFKGHKTTCEKSTGKSDKGREIEDELQTRQVHESPIITRECSIPLVNCDNLVKSMCKNDIYLQDAKPIDDSSAEYDTDFTPALSRRGSFSILNGMEALVEPLVSVDRGTSPVTSVFETICASRDRDLGNMKDNTYEKQTYTNPEVYDNIACVSNWIQTKRNMHDALTHATELTSINEIFEEIIKNKKDLLTDCETDATDISVVESENNFTEVFTVPSLSSIMAKYFEDSPLIYQINSTNKDDPPKTPLKRKLNNSFESISNKVTKMTTSVSKNIAQNDSSKISNNLGQSSSMLNMVNSDLSVHIEKSHELKDESNEIQFDKKHLTSVDYEMDALNELHVLSETPKVSKCDYVDVCKDENISEVLSTDLEESVTSALSTSRKTCHDFNKTYSLSQVHTKNAIKNTSDTPDLSPKCNEDSYDLPIKSEIYIEKHSVIDTENNTYTPTTLVDENSLISKQDDIDVVVKSEDLGSVMDGVKIACAVTSNDTLISENVTLKSSNIVTENITAISPPKSLSIIEETSPVSEQDDVANEIEDVVLLKDEIKSVCVVTSNDLPLITENIIPQSPNAVTKDITEITSTNVPSLIEKLPLPKDDGDVANDTVEDLIQSVDEVKPPCAITSDDLNQTLVNTMPISPNIVTEDTTENVSSPISPSLIDEISLKSKQDDSDVSNKSDLILSENDNKSLYTVPTENIIPQSPNTVTEDITEITSTNVPSLIEKLPIPEDDGDVANDTVEHLIRSVDEVKPPCAKTSDDLNQTLVNTMPISPNIVTEDTTENVSSPKSPSLIDEISLKSKQDDSDVSNRSDLILSENDNKSLYTVPTENIIPPSPNTVTEDITEITSTNVPSLIEKLPLPKDDGDVANDTVEDLIRSVDEVKPPCAKTSDDLNQTLVNTMPISPNIVTEDTTENVSSPKSPSLIDEISLKSKQDDSDVSNKSDLILSENDNKSLCTVPSNNRALTSENTLLKSPNTLTEKSSLKSPGLIDETSLIFIQNDSEGAIKTKELVLLTDDVKSGLGTPNDLPLKSENTRRNFLDYTEKDALISKQQEHVKNQSVTHSGTAILSFNTINEKYINKGNFITVLEKGQIINNQYSNDSVKNLTDSNTIFNNVIHPAEVTHETPSNHSIDVDTIAEAPTVKSNLLSKDSAVDMPSIDYAQDVRTTSNVEDNNDTTTGLTDFGTILEKEAQLYETVDPCLQPFDTEIINKNVDCSSKVTEAVSSVDNVVKSLQSVVSKAELESVNKNCEFIISVTDSRKIGDSCIKHSKDTLNCIHSKDVVQKCSDDLLKESTYGLEKDTSTEVVQVKPVESAIISEKPTTLPDNVSQIVNIQDSYNSESIPKSAIDTSNVNVSLVKHEPVDSEVQNTEFTTTDDILRTKEIYNKAYTCDEKYIYKTEIIVQVQSEIDITDKMTDSSVELESHMVTSRSQKEVCVKALNRSFNSNETTVEDTIDEINKVDEHQEQILCDNETRLIYKVDSSVLLTGLEYEDPKMGKCYIFPLQKISKGSVVCGELSSTVENAASVVQEDKLDPRIKEKEQITTLYDCENFNHTKTKRTYLRHSLKRKINMRNIFLSQKRPRRNSKTKEWVDFKLTERRKHTRNKHILPDLTAASITEAGSFADFKLFLKYYSTVEFSFSITHSPEFIDTCELLKNWPISGPLSENVNEINQTLFSDLENARDTTQDPFRLTLAEELTTELKDTDIPKWPIEETNFNMGFGEGSGRVIQNFDRGVILKVSAATLSDVKHTQPCLQSEKYDDVMEKSDSLESLKQEQLRTIKRYISYLQIREKVQSFFKQTSFELIRDHEEKCKKDITENHDASFPYELFSSKRIQPHPIETIVQVVQVGQLPVSAAAQNPVTCDPRVTQVSDASPQCSAENSPQDDSQPSIKTEYTELTTADINLPLSDDYAQQNQTNPVDSQYSNMSLNTENITIQTELVKSEVKIELEEEEDKEKDSTEVPETNNHLNNVNYLYNSNNTSVSVESEVQEFYNPERQESVETFSQQKPQNGSPEKTDQIAHAMNAAGITTTPETYNTRAQTFVNLLSQKLRQGTVVTTQNPANNITKTTSINAMSLQQALAQILPPPLNQTSSPENNQQNQNTVTPQVLHIVQGKNSSGNHITFVDNTHQPTVISTPNATPVLHIVQNKTAAPGQNSNGSPASQANTFSGISLVDTGLQQGGNQLLHIVNTGNQKNNNAGQLLKRVNLLTNIANVQGSNDQKMVQLVCNSADGKSIQLNAPHQRSMVLRLQPIESTNVQPATPKAAETNQELSPTQPSTNSVVNKDSTSTQQEIKSRSVYEENYAKFIQNSSNKPTLPEKPNSLPKFNQAFGKAVFLDGNQKQNEVNSNNLPSGTVSADNAECPATDNTVNLDHIRQIGSPPLLIRKPTTYTTQAQSNLVQQIKQTIAPMNIQTMHGGVIYTRQIPVNIGGGQTINLITVPSTELLDESGQKQQVSQGETIEPSIIKIVPQNQPSSNTEVSQDDINSNNDNSQQNVPQPQPVLTQMRIKLPMLSKAPPMVSGARVVRPSFFQIQRNVIGGANQVYQQLVLTAAPPLGQQTIRLPQAQARQVKIPENQSSSESQMSSSTLEQLREFDMVLEQVKERSTVQPNNSNSNNSFKMLTPSTGGTDSSASAKSSPTETTQVLYSIGSTQPLNVAYVNRKPSVSNPTTSTFVRSPDSSGVADSPTSSTHSQIPHTSTSEATSSEATSHHKPAKVSSKSKSRPKSSHSHSMKLNSAPPKTSSQKPLEDEQTTQRILYILAEYKEQVENSPDKDKPAPRRRTNPPSNPPGSSKRKKSSSGSRRSGRDLSPLDDSCRTMGSEDSSCGTSQGDCAESCLDSHSPQDSPRKVSRKLTFEQDPPTTPQPRPQLQRNVIVADGQTITVARGTGGKPATAVLMPANYILPVSMVKGGQQIAIVTNRGPKLLTVGGGEGGATNALLLQRLIGPAGLKPVLSRPGVRHVRLPTAALQNLQAFNLASATNIQPPDSTASSASERTPPDLVETNRSDHSPWTDRDSEMKPDRSSSPDESEPWHLPSSGDPHDYSYEETVRTDNMDRTVLLQDQNPDRYSPDMEAQRIFDKMFDVDTKKSYIDSPRCAYDVETSDCDDKPYQVVHKKDGNHRQTRLVSAAALRHKYAILEHELRLQKSLSEECEDLGVDSPSASELFPEAELLFAASPAQEHGPDTPHNSHTPQPTLVNQSVIQPDIDDQIATDQLIPRQNVADERQELDVNLGLEDVGIVTVSEDGMQATITLDQEEFARSHPNTTFHSEPTDAEEVQPFTISSLKSRHITSTIFHSNRAPATVLMTAPQATVISQVTGESSHNTIKYADIDNMIHTIPSTHTNNINLSSVLVKDDGISRFDNILTDSREIHLSNTASAIVHAVGNATQVIRRVCYDDNKRERERESFFMDEPDAIIAGDDAKMVAEDSSRDATMESMGADVDDGNSSPERHTELFWESNSASASESRRPLDFSSDSEKCCKSPSYDETNSTDSSGVGTHVRLDTVIKEARGVERSGSAGSSADDTHPPLRTYPPKRLYHNTEGEMERSLSGKTRAGERSPDLEVRRRASGRGVVKRGCHCCNGSPAPPRPKKPRQRKPTTDFTN